MVAYAVLHRDAFKVLNITAHASLVAATDHVNKSGDQWSGFAVHNPEDLSLTISQLVTVYNALTGASVVKFSDKSTAQRRTLDAIEDRYNRQPSAELYGADVSAAPTQEEDSAMTEQTQTTEAKAGGKKKRAKKEANGAAAKVKPVKYLAGKVGDFKPVRAGTVRASLLKLMNGTKTYDKIAESLETSKSNLRVTLSCLVRDCGIGYEIGEDEKVTAIYPGSKTIDDAIVAAAAKE